MTMMTMITLTLKPLETNYLFLIMLILVGDLQTPCHADLITTCCIVL